MKTGELIRRYRKMRKMTQRISPERMRGSPIPPSGTTSSGTESQALRIWKP